MTRVKEREDYRWVIVAGLFLCLVVSWGIIFNASSIFVTPIQADLQTTRSVILLAMVFKGTASVFASVLAGPLMNRYGALRVMRLSSLLLIASFFSFGFIQTIPHYFIMISIQVAATTWCGFLPVSVLINEWFPGKNATVMGLAFMGSGFGGMLFNVLGGNWIVLLGWRQTAFMFSGVMALILIPITWLILVPKPRTNSLTGQTGTVTTSGIRLEEAMKTQQFWWILSSFTIMSITLNGVINNLTPAFQDLGYGLKTAAVITSVAMIGMSGGKLLIGQLFNRAGLRKASILANLSMIICLGGLIFGATIPGVGAALLGFVIGGGFASMSVPFLADGIYGRADFARISGVLQGAFNIGSILGPLSMSPLYSLTGGYGASWTLFIGFLCINFMIYLKYLPNHAREVF